LSAMASNAAPSATRSTGLAAADSGFVGSFLAGLWLTLSAPLVRSPCPLSARWRRRGIRKRNPLRPYHGPVKYGYGLIVSRFEIIAALAPGAPGVALRYRNCGTWPLLSLLGCGPRRGDAGLGFARLFRPGQAMLSGVVGEPGRCQFDRRRRQFVRRAFWSP